MLSTRGYAIKDPQSILEPFSFERRNLRPHDVLIKIQYCGVCHSDIHQARNEWGDSIYPMVPGHEIVGQITQVGSSVKNFKVGDTAGVGCFIDSCGNCAQCGNDEEQFCQKHLSLTYNGTEQDLTTPTYGGYSSQIVVNENYTLKISSKFPLANVAPLLCAGITTYSPLRKFIVRSGQRVGIVGLGGLGHVAVKLAHAMGAEVTVLSTSKAKEQDAFRLGAQNFVVTKDAKNLERYANYFDVILDTASAPHDLNTYISLLNVGGVLVLVGIPEKPFEIEPLPLIMKGRMLCGSLIGGIRETQEMLDFCAEKNITADVEIIPIQKINEAFERTIKGDVRYRFVIDMKTL
jgi:uncharacterized zinc-type alcohol dehydrogenase-like protein